VDYIYKSSQPSAVRTFFKGKEALKIRILAKVVDSSSISTEVIQIIKLRMLAESDKPSLS
jgi:hypothetical protein